MSTPENTPEPDDTTLPTTVPAEQADEPGEAEAAPPATTDPALADAMRSIRGVGENLRGED